MVVGFHDLNPQVMSWHVKMISIRYLYIRIRRFSNLLICSLSQELLEDDDDFEVAEPSLDLSGTNA